MKRLHRLQFETEKFKCVIFVVFLVGKVKRTDFLAFTSKPLKSDYRWWGKKSKEEVGGNVLVPFLVNDRLWLECWDGI